MEHTFKYDCIDPLEKQGVPQDYNHPLSTQSHMMISSMASIGSMKP